MSNIEYYDIQYAAERTIILAYISSPVFYLQVDQRG